MLSSSLFSNDSSKNSTKIQRCHHRTSTQLSCPSILAARLTDTTGQQRAAEVFSFLWRHSYDYFLSPRQLLLVSDVWPPSPTKLQAGIRTKNCFFHVFEQSPASSLLLYTFQSRTKPVPFGFLASRSVWHTKMQHTLKKMALTKKT